MGSYSVYLNLITTMEGESIPPHSEMEAGNMNPEAVPVKSMVGYSDEGPDGHHQAEMDQEPSFSNGNGNGANDEEPKEEPKTDSFDLFGSMISKMPAKPADEEKEKVKDEDDSNEEKKIVLTKCLTLLELLMIKMMETKRKKTAPRMAMKLILKGKNPQKMTMQILKTKSLSNPEMVLQPPLLPTTLSWTNLKKKKTTKLIW